MRGIAGYFYFKGQSKKQKAILRADDEACLTVLRQDGDVLAGPEHIKNLSITSRLGNTPRIFRFPSGGVFETLDNDRVDALTKKPRPANAWLHTLESKWQYIVVALFATVIFVWAGIQYGIPALAESAAFAISAENNRRIGQGTLDLLDKVYVDESTLPTERQEELREKFSGLIDEVDGLPVRVEFRDAENSFGANAFALPDGTVVFTDQLIELAENDDELLGVYAHEIGHVARRHSLRNVLQSSALAVIIVAVTGDVSSVSALIAAAPTMIIQSGYSRDFEREADRYAIRRLLENDIDPMCLGDVLQRMEQKARGDRANDDDENSGWMDYISSHPGTDERIEMIRKESEKFIERAS
jgi:Putative Zn-dependent protease, contains TPR repeats